MIEQRFTLSARSVSNLDDQERTKFLAHTRHELRTPLNAILGYSEMLLEIAEEDVVLNDLADLHEVNSAARNLLRQINLLFDPANARLDSPELQEKLSPWLDRLVECNARLLQQFQKGGLTLYQCDLERITLAAQKLRALLADFTEV